MTHHRRVMMSTTTTSNIFKPADRVSGASQCMRAFRPPKKSKRHCHYLPVRPAMSSDVSARHIHQDRAAVKKQGANGFNDRSSLGVHDGFRLGLEQDCGVPLGRIRLKWSRLSALDGPKGRKGFCVTGDRGYRFFSSRLGEGGAGVFRSPRLANRRRGGFGRKVPTARDSTAERRWRKGNY